MVTPFSDEQSRQLINLSQQYDVWIQASRAARKFKHHLTWKRVGNREYLYRIRDRAGNGTSLGARSPSTEKQHADFTAEKAAALARVATSKAVLDETCRICRALRVPQIAPEAAQIAREADLRGDMGKRLMVCGTTAIAAYEIEANGFISDAPSTTRDLDIALLAGKADPGEPILMPILKAVDSTYTTNTERTFQAQNAAAYEVEALASPSVAQHLARSETPMPIPLPEQEWLLPGTRVSRVVIARDGSPARLVAPDPRWYALQKLWLAAQPKRDALKRPKDAAQGIALLNAIATTMPQYPLDPDFESTLPSELVRHYEAWNSNRPAPAPATW